MLERLVDHLRHEEGWESSAYVDSEGYLTIGYGFLIDRKKGGELPKEIGEQWLMFAASRRWWALCCKHPWLLEQPEDVQVALGSMTYQLGVEGVCKFKLMLAALQLGDRKLAAKEALKSRWAEQTPARAERIAGMIRG